MEVKGDVVATGESVVELLWEAAILVIDVGANVDEARVGG
jgi:hypothetical protein